MELRLRHWDRVFDIKQHWGASGAAIVRRAHDLRLLDAARCQQAYRHMSWRGWTMRDSFGETALDIAAKVGWTREVMQTVVCFPLPDDELQKKKGALVFLDARRASTAPPPTTTPTRTPGETCPRRRR